MFTQTIDPQLRFRQAVQSPTAPLSYIQRLSLKLHDLRNTDPATRQTSLALAALAGRIDVCLWLIEEGHDEDEISADAAGQTIAHIAAGLGYLDLLEIYLDQYDWVHAATNNQGATPLHMAAKQGQFDTAAGLIEWGADVNAPDLRGETPLHYASSWGKVNVCKLLVESGCDHAAKNHDGFTAAEYSYSFAGLKALEGYIKLQLEEIKRAQRERKQSKASGVSPQASRTIQSDPSAPPSRSHARANTAPADPSNQTVGLGFDFPPPRTRSNTSRLPDSSSSYLGPPLSSPAPPPPTTPPPDSTFFGHQPQTLSPVSMRRTGRALSNASGESSMLGSPGAGGRRRVVIKDPSPRREAEAPTEEMMRLNFGGGGGGLEADDSEEEDDEEADEVAEDRDRPTTASSASASGGHRSRSESSHSYISNSSDAANQHTTVRRGPPPSHQATITQLTAPHHQATITPRTAFPSLDSPATSEFGQPLSPAPQPIQPLSPLAPGYRAVSSPVGSSRGSPMLQGVSGGSIMMRRAVSGEGRSSQGDSPASSVAEGQGISGKERTRKDSSASHVSTASKLGKVFGLGRKG